MRCERSPVIEVHCFQVEEGTVMELEGGYEQDAVSMLDGGRPD